MSKRIQVVDRQDDLLGAKTYEEVDRDHDIYRVSALWLTNPEGKVLLAQRASAEVNPKAHDPGKWGPAAAGTVEEGETYQSNIVKEMEEEIGLTGLDLQTGSKIFVDGKHRYFCQWFMAEVDLDINTLKLDAHEVARVAWFSLESLKEKLEQNPDQFTPGLNQFVDNLP